MSFVQSHKFYYISRILRSGFRLLVFSQMLVDLLVCFGSLGAVSGSAVVFSFFTHGPQAGSDYGECIDRLTGIHTLGLPLQAQLQLPCSIIRRSPFYFIYSPPHISHIVDVLA